MGSVHLFAAATLLGSAVAPGPAPVTAAGQSAAVDAPIVTSTGLTDGQIVGRGQRLYPSWTDDTGVSKVDLLLNGAVVKSYVNADQNRGLFLAVPAQLHGTDAEVTVRAFDGAGNHGEATSRVHIDTEVPHATLSPPLESFVSGIVTLTATDVSDDLARISLFDHATGQEVAKTTAAPWTMTWDTTGRTVAAYVHFELTDKVGNVTFVYGFYAVDNTGPTVTGLGFPTQADHTVVDRRISGLSRLTATFDGRSPLERVEWWVDGTLRSTSHIPATGSYPQPYFDWDTGHENRTAVLEVRAYDILGRHATLTRRVVIDNTGPAITAISPANRALVRGTQFKATVSGSDPSGIRDAELVTVSSDDKAPFTALVPAGKDGTRTLTWTLTDRLGNTSTARRVVIVDNTKPKTTITKAPGNGTKVKGKVKVAVSAADRNGINRVELLVNGKVVAKDTTASYAFTVNTNRYGKKIKVQVRVYDKAGNVTTSSTRTWRH
ncbi:Ig-like domain-containing protein [Actinoplanes philippinensis]|uniref:Ig-like domain-containing protein n=1 Tax=Actinoplanes philippinensis TaxID=35752 RepID=UPI0033E76568